MDLQKIYEVLEPNRLKNWLKSTMSDIGITTLDCLRDDKKINSLAVTTYRRIPLFPFRTAIKCTLGKEGFNRLVFLIRDKMLTAGSMDLSWLSYAEIKAMLSNIKN